jgi:hypothetical protein
MSSNVAINAGIMQLGNHYVQFLPGLGGGSDSIHLNVSLILSIFQAEQLMVEDSESNLAPIYHWDSIFGSHKDLDRRARSEMWCVILPK